MEEHPIYGFARHYNPSLSDAEIKAKFIDGGRYLETLDRMRQETYPDLDQESFLTKFHSKYEDLSKKKEPTASVASTSAGISGATYSWDAPDPKLVSGVASVGPITTQSSSGTGVALDESKRASQELALKKARERENFDKPAQLSETQKAQVQASVFEDKEYRTKFSVLSEDNNTLQKAIEASEARIKEKWGENWMEEYNARVEAINNPETQNKEDLIKKQQEFEADQYINDRNNFITALEANQEAGKELLYSDKYERARALEKIDQERQNKAETQGWGNSVLGIAQRAASKFVGSVGHLMNIGENIATKDKKYTTWDAVEDFLIDFQSETEKVAPRPTKYTRPLFTNTVTTTLNGQKVQVDYIDGKPSVIRDYKGAIISDVSEDEAIRLSGYKPKTQWNGKGLVYQTGEVLADVLVQAATTKGIGGTLVKTGMGAKTAYQIGVTASVMGQMAGPLYNEGLKMFDGDKKKASIYAATAGLAIGVSANLFGLESKLAGGKGGFLDNMTVAQAAKSLNPKTAGIQRAKSMLKEGLGEAFEETILEQGIQNATAMMLNGDPEDIDLNEMKGTAVISFAVGALLGGSVDNSMWLVAAENPDEFRKALQVEKDAGKNVDVEKMYQKALKIRGLSEIKDVTEEDVDALDKVSELKDKSEKAKAIGLDEQAKVFKEEAASLEKEVLKEKEAEGENVNIAYETAKLEGSKVDIDGEIGVVEKTDSGYVLNTGEELLPIEDNEVEAQLIERGVSMDRPKESQKKIFEASVDQAISDLDVTQEQADALKQTTSANAQNWAKRTGKTEEEFYEKFKPTVSRNTEGIPDDALKQIVGEKANIPEAKRGLQVAKLAEGKYSPKNIYLATGWEKVDGRWKYDLPDVEVGTLEGTNKLGDVAKGGILDAYPDAKGIEITVDPNLKTQGLRQGNKISIRDGADKTTLIHELQHWVQQKEGFAGGASMDRVSDGMFSKLQAAKDKFMQSNPNLTRALKGEDVELSERDIEQLIENKKLLNDYKKTVTDIFNKYQSVVGEAEARNAARRSEMSPEQRKQTAISETEDTKDKIYLSKYGEQEESAYDMVLASNGKPSILFKNLIRHVNGNHNKALELYNQTKTKEFKDWFGGSKLIDENGEPKVFFTGTGRYFEEFSKDYFYSGEGAMFYGAGFYFTENYQTAKSYSSQTSRNASVDTLYSFIDELRKEFVRNDSNENPVDFIKNKIKSLEYQKKNKKGNIEQRAFIQKENALIDVFTNVLHQSGLTTLDKFTPSRGYSVEDEFFVRLARFERDLGDAVVSERFNIGDNQVIYPVFLKATNSLNWESPVSKELQNAVYRRLRIQGYDIRDAKVSTNGDLYKQVAAILKEPFIKGLNVRQYRKTSEWFLKNFGIDSVKHITQSEFKRGDYFKQSKGEEQIIIFEPNQVKSVGNVGSFGKSSNIYLQQQEGEVLGAFSTIDGETSAWLFDGATVETLFHEIDPTTGHFGHAVLYDIFDNALPEYKAQAEADVKAIEEWLGATDRNWTREQHEKYVAAGEKYLREGVAPTPELKPVFERLKQWLTDIFNSVKDRKDINITPEVRAVFDRMLGGNRSETLPIIDSLPPGVNGFMTDKFFGFVMNSKAVDWIKKVFVNTFYAGGNLPKDVAALNYRRIARIQGMMKQAEITSNKLKGLINGKSKQQVTELNDALQTGSDTYANGDPIEPEILLILGDMRKHIDSLSQALISSGIATGKLEAVISGNLETYLTRSYEAHFNKDWIKKVKDTATYTRARAYLENKFAQEEADAQQKIVEYQKKRPNNPEFWDKKIKKQRKKIGRDVDAELEAMLMKQSKDLRMADVAKSGSLGSMNLGVFKKRKDIPEEIRDLFGEVKDPLVNYMTSIFKIAHILENDKFLAEVEKQGLDKFLFDRPTGNHTVALPDTAQMGDLAGYYTTPEIAEAFRTYNKPIGEFDENSDLPTQLYGGLMKVSALSKSFMTVFSVGSGFRNLFSNPFLMLQKGGINPASKHVKRAIEVFYNKDEKEIVELYSRGVMGEGITFAELADIRKQYQKEMRGVPKDAKDKFKEGWEKYVTGPLKAFYAFGDDFFRVVDYFRNQDKMAVLNYGKKFRDLTPDEQENVKQLAADRVSSESPTYSRLPRNIKALRRNPAVAPFPSFPYEMVRVSYNIFSNLINDMKNGQDTTIKVGGIEMSYKNLMFAKTMIGAATVSIVPFIIKDIAKIALGWDDDDEESLKYFVPFYHEGSILIPHTSNNGNVSYLDLGYMMPQGHILSTFAAFNDTRYNVAENTLRASEKFFEPFYSLDPLMKASIEAVSGSMLGKTGRPISVIGEQGWLLDRFYHVQNKMTPGTVKSFQRVLKSFNEPETDYYGKLDPLAEGIAIFPGYRSHNVDIHRSFGFVSQSIAKKIDDTRLDYKIQAEKESTKAMTPDDRKEYLDKIREREIKDYNKFVTDLHKIYVAAIDFPEVDKKKIDQALETVKLDPITRRNIQQGKLDLPKFLRE